MTFSMLHSLQKGGTSHMVEITGTSHYVRLGMSLSLQFLFLVQTFKVVRNRTFYPSRHPHPHPHHLSMSVLSLFIPRYTHYLTGR